MARAKSDRRWFSGGPKATWALAVSVLVFGGGVAWIALGLGLCEDTGSPGSETYCNHGGWEASGLVIAGLALLAIVVPAAGAVAGSRRLFWIGLLSPLPLAVLDVALSATLGRG